MPEEIVLDEVYKAVVMMTFIKLGRDKVIFSFKMFLLAMLLVLSKTDIQLLSYDFVMMPVSSKNSDKHQLENEGVVLERVMLHWIK